MFESFKLTLTFFSQSPPLENHGLAPKFETNTHK